MAPFADAPEEVDQTIFSVDKSGNIGSASRLAERVVEEAHRYDAHPLCTPLSTGNDAFPKMAM